MDLNKDAYEGLKYYFRHFDPRHERFDEIYEKLGYIDIQNIAKRMNAELLMFTGLMDTICPPSTQFAMYNKVKSKKDVIFYPEYGHEELKGAEDQIQKLINAIVALASCVLTYTIIMMVIAKFFSDPDETNAALMDKILSGNVFEADLSDDNLEALTLISTVVLVYVLNFIYKQIPQISKMVLGIFGVSEEKQLSEKMADDALTLSKNVINTAVSIGKTIINGGENKN